MNKRVVAISKKPGYTNEQVLEKVKEDLGAKWGCCVLITCTEPGENGKMEVEMNFDGDESLAAFLVDNASQVFEERCALRESR